MMTKDIEVASIRDRDLRPILRHFNLEDALDQHKIECSSCSRTITWDNLGAMRVSESTLVLYCDLSECLNIASSSKG